ncbi:MAG: glycoside hydrolase family 127 protein [Bacteroidota bacterium]|nr:glycoside hydrolase family 127 protein [Bacteroidota bacterium]MDP4204459.1 glycoside hydrolase family 127 protein [Bacteroidota bacterium]
MKRFILLFAVAIGMQMIDSRVYAIVPSVQGTVIALKARPFDMKQVKLLDGPYKKALDLNYKYLKEFKTERLLYNFKKNAGLPTSENPLGGWESPETELRGHFTGHFLSALVLMYSTTHDPYLLSKADTLVNGLAQVQKALGNSGYLSAFPEEYIDRVENHKPVWAPWYTLHKILAGLIDAYQLGGNKKALDIAEKMSDWVKSRTDRLTYDQMQSVLRVEYGGMSESFYNLYGITKDEKYLVLGKRFEQKSLFTPLSNYQDKLHGLHANTQIPKVIGAARAYELTGDTYYKNIAKYFWNQVTKTRAYTTGGTSNYEYWRSEPCHLNDQLSANDHENCCTYNMLKLTSHLFTWEPSAELADYYERALINGIMGTEHPEVGGAMMYYVPMHPGLFRLYCAPEYSYVCCSGTGIESFGKFGDNIYFYNDNELFVNQFIASEVYWKEKQVRIVQQTNFPDQSVMNYTVHTSQPVEFALKLRIPYWSEKGVAVKVNGKKLDAVSSPSSYLVINRVWKENDKVELSLPMTLRTECLPDNHNRVSIMYGPLVLAAALGDEGMTDEMKRGLGGDADRMTRDGAAVEVPRLITDQNNLEQWIKPVAGKSLTFKTMGVGNPSDITLIPFFRIYGQRYSVYLDLCKTNEWKNYQAKRKPVPAGAIDYWVAGDSISNDEHNFQSYYSEKGVTADKNWVKSPQWFRVDYNVSPDKPVTFRATYYGDESSCVFRLQIDGEPIETQPLMKHEDGFFQIDYQLPFELTKGHKRIAISYAVPEKKAVTIGATTVEHEKSAYETPKLFSGEVRVKE